MMQSRTLKWLVPAAAAAAVVVVASIFLTTGSKPAYAWEQTVAAIQRVKFVHMIWRSPDGTPKDERWIEIGPDGVQVRYRQECRDERFPIHALFVQNGDTVMDWRKDKNTVILWDKKDQTYVFVENWRSFFADFTNKGVITIQENVGYKGRPAHHVRWSNSQTDCYVDPVTELPITVGPYEVSYENPPAGVFDIILPKGVPVVDKRPGAAPTPEPEWLKQGPILRENHEDGIKAMLQGNYSRATDLFARAVEHQPLDDWAWFYLGRARYQLGQYDEAIKSYDRIFAIFNDFAAELKQHKPASLQYCNLARGLAYRAKGLEKQAKADFAIVLPDLIWALRHADGSPLYDRADGLIRSPGSKDEGTEPERLLRVVKRLQEITGQTFSFDPAGPAEARETAIAAWENWWKAHQAEYPAPSSK